MTKIHRAKLDPDGIYRGHEPVPGKAALKPDEVEVPADCDLEPGRYRWDGATFLPVKSPEPEDVVDERHTLAAIAAGFRAIEEKQPGTLPEKTLRWLKWYGKTVDAKGAPSGKKG